jgi:hypothetical protein
LTTETASRGDLRLTKLLFLKHHKKICENLRLAQSCWAKKLPYSRKLHKEIFGQRQPAKISEQF